MLDGEAGNIRVTSRSRRASALGSMIECNTFSGVNARVVLARIHTLLVNTAVVRRTLRVGSAADDETFVVSVSFESNGAPTVGTMTCSITFCVRCTRVVHQTRVGTDTFVASMVIGTFRVDLTAYRETAYVRHTKEVHLTGADCPVIYNITIGVGSTFARIFALSVNANL